MLQHRSSDGHAYIHYEGADKRLDEWIPGSELRRIDDSDAVPSGTSNGKRKWEEPSSRPGSPTGSAHTSSAETTPLPDAPTMATTPRDTMTEDDFDVQHYKQMTAQRNFDKVNFGQWQIKTWCVSCSGKWDVWIHMSRRYFSPYPLIESEGEESTTPQGRPSTPTLKTPSVNRRSHGRTSDLLAGGIMRSYLAGEKSVLWVCERCFKYMAEGSVWELHAVSALYFQIPAWTARLMMSWRKNVTEDIRLEERYTREGHTPSGKWMGPKRK